MRTDSGPGWAHTTRATIVVLAAVAVAACGSSGSSKAGSTTQPSASVTTTTKAALGKGPPSATLSFAGDQVVTGALTAPTITCSFPTVTGPEITVLAGTLDPNVSTFMFVNGDAIQVRIASGSGKTYLQRSFTGKGATGFDAARGGHLDSALHENVVPTAKAKSLPAVNAIKGDIDCAGQRPGSAIIAFSGQTSEGAITGALGSARVTCNAISIGQVVTAVGVVQVGTTHALVFVNGQPNAFNTVVEVAGAPQTGVFNSAAGASATTTAHGMQVSGNAVEQVAAGKTAHTLHVQGSAVCGTVVPR